MLVTPCGVFAQLPKVVTVKEFSGIYPASYSLRVPFHGCVTLDSELPKGEGEFWLSLEHLVTDADFSKLEVLVNSERTILGARATFNGTREQWHAARGYSSRQRVLWPFLGGDGPPLAETLPLAYDGTDFGGMVFTFDNGGNVSWRVVQGADVTNELEYVRGREKHKATCEECKNISTEPWVVLPEQTNSEQDGTDQSATAPVSKSEHGSER